jgi:predicted amidophosphoribosyltransferase
MTKSGTQFNTPELEEKLIDGWVNWCAEEIANQNVQFDYIIRVPGHDEVTVNKSKCMYQICDRLSKKIGATYLSEVLLKSRVTTPQRQIVGDEDRRENVAGSMIVQPNNGRINNKNILIIDDVKTEGWSALEALNAVQCLGNGNEFWLVVLAEATTDLQANASLNEYCKRYFDLEEVYGSQVERKNSTGQVQKISL